MGDGMGERLRRGLKLRNKCEIGVGPLKGKNQGERLELSQTRGCSEDHSKRAGSHRARRKPSDRGRSPSRRIEGQSQKTTYGWDQVQCRWPCNCTFGHGRTMERSKNSQRPAASARTTRKELAGSCRPPTEARTPSGRT